MSIQIDYAKKINDLHHLIELQLRTPIKTAIEVGKLLSEVKRNIGHGNYTKWINDNCLFSERTAYNYIGCYEHNDKIATLANLQSAYKIINQIEYQDKLNETQKKKIAINEYEKTGIKPQEWNRTYDYEYSKKRKEDDNRTERILKAKENMRSRNKDFDFEKSDRLRKGFDFEKSDDLHKKVDDYLKNEKEKNKYREKLAVSFQEQNSFFDVIDIYLQTLDTDSIKLEALHNTLKYVKELITKYQKESIK